MRSVMFEYNKHKTNNPRSIVESKKNSRTCSCNVVRFEALLIIYAAIPKILPKEPSTSLQKRGIVRLP
jgi:hypothetical protein